MCVNDLKSHMFGGTNLLVELDVLHNLKCEGEVTEETVHAEKADDTEVAEELVQGASAVLSDDLT